MRYTCALTRAGESIATGTLTIVCVAYRPNEPMKAIPWPPQITARFAVAAGAGS
jgi:acyl-CoA thioesterase FadM